MGSKICPHCKNEQDEPNVCKECNRPFSPRSNAFYEWCKLYFPSDEKRQSFVAAEQVRVEENLTKREFWEKFGSEFSRFISKEEFFNEEEEIFV